MPLVRTYDDVGNIELRGQDDCSDTGWRYVPFEFARGVPDLTPVKVKGSTGDDVLYGGAGNDKLYGGEGHNLLIGGKGADLIDEESGNDVLSGGAGDDVFIFFRPTDRFKINEDTITDFELGSDKIQIAEDMPALTEFDLHVNDDTNDLLSLTVSYKLEPNWEALLRAFYGGFSYTVDYRRSEMTLEFDDLNVSDFFALVDDAGETTNQGLNNLVFDVV